MSEVNANSKTPAIRFQGFSGEWEETNLDALADIVRGASPRPIEDPKWFDKDSHVGWLRIKDVSEQDGRIHRLTQRISKLGEEKTRVIHKPHLLLSIAASVGKPVVNYVSTGVHDGFLIFKQPNFDTEFMYQWLKMFEDEWQKYGQPGSQVNLNSDIVKNQNIAIPDEQEQTQIGNFFQQLDTLIKQHQQKRDKLLSVKKALLEKMFPQQGDTLPAIRFKGFSGEWEEKALGNVCSDTYGGGTPSTTNLRYWVGSIPWIQSSDLIEDQVIGARSRKTISESGLKKSPCKLIPRGSIAIVTRVGVGKIALMEIDYATSQDFLSMSNLKVDALFAVYSIWRKIQKDKSAVQGTSIKGVTKEELLSKNILIAEDIEQTQIGHFFQQLDTLINQHQTQLTKLNNVKQSMLSKMFV